MLCLTVRAPGPALQEDSSRRVVEKQY